MSDWIEVTPVYGKDKIQVRKDSINGYQRFGGGTILWSNPCKQDENLQVTQPVEYFNNIFQTNTGYGFKNPAVPIEKTGKSCANCFYFDWYYDRCNKYQEQFEDGNYQSIDHCCRDYKRGPM